jgi:hypothetical protein
LDLSLADDRTRLGAIATQSFILKAGAAPGRVQSVVSAECLKLQCSLKPLGGGFYRLDVDSSATNAPIGVHGELLENLRKALAAQNGLKLYDNSPVRATPQK